MEFLQTDGGKDETNGISPGLTNENKVNSTIEKYTSLRDKSKHKKNTRQLQAIEAEAAGDVELSSAWRKAANESGYAYDGYNTTLSIHLSRIDPDRMEANNPDAPGRLFSPFQMGIGAYDVPITYEDNAISCQEKADKIAHYLDHYQEFQKKAKDAETAGFPVEVVNRYQDIASYSRKEALYRVNGFPMGYKHNVYILAVDNASKSIKAELDAVNADQSSTGLIQRYKRMAYFYHKAAESFNESIEYYGSGYENCAVVVQRAINILLLAQALPGKGSEMTTATMYMDIVHHCDSIATRWEEATLARKQRVIDQLHEELCALQCDSKVAEAVELSSDEENIAEIFRQSAAFFRCSAESKGKGNRNEGSNWHNAGLYMLRAGNLALKQRTSTSTEEEIKAENLKEKIQSFKEVSALFQQAAAFHAANNVIEAKETSAKAMQFSESLMNNSTSSKK